MSIPPTRIVPRQIITIWSGNGATAGYEHATTRAILEAVKPQAIQLHTSAEALARAGATLTERVRKEHPESEVLWAIAGDRDDVKIEGFGDFWEEAAKAAVACGVRELQLNCEGRWTDRPKGSLRAAIDKTHKAAPTLTLTHTAFDGPVWLSDARFGYGESYPWAEALGAGSPIARSAPQVYWAAPGGEDLPPGRGRAREALHERSWKAAQRKGLLKPELIVDSYQQCYNCRVDELCLVAADNPNTYWWTVPTAVDGAGVIAMACMSKLARLGKTIAEFQAEAGLAADWKIGPRTREALLGSFVVPRTLLK